MKIAGFREIVFLDFEYAAQEGERPEPVCSVVYEFYSRRWTRYWFGGGAKPWTAPGFPIDEGTLVVGYYLCADLTCFLVLDWPLPVWVCDLYAEFRRETNGRFVPCGNGLLGALTYFGLHSTSTASKDIFRHRISKGGPFSDGEQRTILNYCQQDVDALVELFPHLISSETDLRPVVLRGDFMKSIASAELTGIPIDTGIYTRMLASWPALQDQILARVNAEIPVFHGRHFKQDLFRDWLKTRNMLAGWPTTPRSGRLVTDDDTLRRKAAIYPALEPLRQARQMLVQLRELKLSIGSDGRNRCLLSPFGTKTSRCAPSSTRFIFSAPSFLRGLIKPEAGHALAVIDWVSQEFGIAAALSKDSAMLEAYQSGDVYLALAKRVGAVPQDATRETHPKERELFKAVALGVQYGMRAFGLAELLGCSLYEAETWLENHRCVFSQFWQWLEAAGDCAQLDQHLESTFGWRFQYSDTTSFRTIRNWPIQTNGAEMLRIACIGITRDGLLLNAPIHDAVMVESAEADIEQVVTKVQTIMQKASETVLAGIPLRTDVVIIRPPDRHRGKRSALMWDWIEQALMQTAT